MARFGLDIGTDSTVVWDCAGGFVFDEPSVMVDLPRGGVGIGQEAADLVDRLPVGARAVYPVSAGVVTDLEGTRRYVRAVLRRVLPRPWQRTRLTAAAVVPAGASALERRALVEAAEEAGITHVHTLPAPVAAAVGSGLDPLDRRVHMIADVGAGTAEIVATCWGEVLAVRSSRDAGDLLTAAVRTHLRDEHRLLLSPASAEELTHRISEAAEDEEVAAAGRRLEHGRPCTVRVPAAELQGVLAPLVDGIAGTLARVLDDLPARALDDLAADGVLLVGGGAPVRGLRAALEAGLGLPVKQAENPTTCAAEGAARALLVPDLLRAYRGS